MKKRPGKKQNASGLLQPKALAFKYKYLKGEIMTRGPDVVKKFCRRWNNELWVQCYKEIFNVDLCYAHFQALWLTVQKFST